MTIFPDAGDRVCRTVVITAEHIGAFGDLVSDHAPVHFDSEFAKRNGFEGRIAHGLFVTALVSGMLGEELPGPDSVINEIKVKYRAPVYVGDIIQIELCVVKVVPAVSAIMLTFDIVTEGSEAACVTGTALCSLPRYA